MFPFVRENLRQYLNADWDSDSLRECLPLLAQDLSHPDVESWLNNQSRELQVDQVEGAVLGLMDADAKSTGLKQLQGLIWKDGFHSGQLVAHVYDDVPPALKHWHEQGFDIRIYSSGSVDAQKLFFGHTIAGNLLPYFSGHYDTTTGLKRESSSYQSIASEFGVPAGQILFVSDIAEELAAAEAAGMQTALSLRPGNKPVPDDHPYTAITSFNQIETSS